MGRQRQPEIRQRLLDACTEHALADGLPDRLAPLAAAAGTSDRMLLYHFGSRDLPRAVLAHARQRQLETFGDLLHVRANEPYATTLGRAWTVMSGPHGQPYLRMFGQLRESTEQQLWPDFPPRGHHRLARAARPPPPDCCRSVPGGWTFSSTTPVSPAGRNLSRWLRPSGVRQAADVWSANRNSGTIRHSPGPSRADLVDGVSNRSSKHANWAGAISRSDAVHGEQADLLSPLNPPSTLEDCQSGLYYWWHDLSS